MAETKITIQLAAVPAYTPWAFRVTKLRDGVEQFIAELQPEGTPDPAQVARVKAHLLATVQALPATANAVEIMVEANNTGAADHINVIVWPKIL